MDLIPLLAGALAGTISTTVIPEIVKTIVAGRASERGTKFNAEQEILEEVVHARNRSYTELWDRIGFICPPHMMGGLLDKDQGISRTQMEELAQDIDRWYRKNGAVMDATSRYWVLALRERCFEWVYQKPHKELFTWNDDRAVEIWLTKTALRISMNRNLLSPGFERIRSRRQAWLEIAREIDVQLLRNYRLVRSVWKAEPPIAARSDEDIENMIEALLAIGKPPGRRDRIKDWLYGRRLFRRLRKENRDAPAPSGPAGS